MSIVKKIYGALLDALELFAVSALTLAIGAVVYSANILVFLCLWYHDIVYLYIAVPCAIVGRLAFMYVNKVANNPRKVR